MQEQKSRPGDDFTLEVEKVDGMFFESLKKVHDEYVKMKQKEEEPEPKAPSSCTSIDTIERASKMIPSATELKERALCQYLRSIGGLIQHPLTRRQGYIQIRPEDQDLTKKIVTILEEKGFICHCEEAKPGIIQVVKLSW